MSKENSTRTGCKDVFRAFLVKNARYAGDLEIPCIEAEDQLPTRLIPFSKAFGSKDYDAWVHFYEDDVSFERLWNQPNKYMPKEVREITMYDELDLDMLGDEKTALFLIMSDTDSTFAFLISLIYSILFNRLCERADDVYGGRLPIHVRCLIDEAANIGQIPNLERLMATIRSREISACLVLQAQSQLKALYKDNMDTIIGNCDSSLFLGGKEETTLKSWNSLLGKETIDLYNTSVTKGTQESHGQNFQKLGKDLMSVDELAVMDGGKCLLQVRGVRPFLSRKYDITKHPNYRLLSDFNKKNAFDIEKFLSTRLSVRSGELYHNYEVTPEELALHSV